MCDKYNGWSNYQTWVFNLWFDDFFADAANSFYQGNDTASDATRELATYIKDYEELINPLIDLGDSSAWVDLLTHAIGMIDFYEIAEHYIDEIIAQEEVTV